MILAVYVTVDYEHSLFFLGVTEGTRREMHDKREILFFVRGLSPSFLASRGFAARARALPLLNLKKKRDCSQSNLSEVKGASGAIVLRC